MSSLVTPFNVPFGSDSSFICTSWSPKRPSNPEMTSVTFVRTQVSTRRSLDCNLNHIMFSQELDLLIEPLTWSWWCKQLLSTKECRGWHRTEVSARCPTRRSRDHLAWILLEIAGRNLWDGASNGLSSTVQSPSKSIQAFKEFKSKSHLPRQQYCNWNPVLVAESFRDRFAGFPQVLQKRECSEANLRTELHSILENVCNCLVKLWMKLVKIGGWLRFDTGQSLGVRCHEHPPHRTFTIFSVGFEEQTSFQYF